MSSPGVTQYELRLFMDHVSCRWLEKEVLAPLRAAGFEVDPNPRSVCLRYMLPAFKANIKHILDGSVSAFTGTWAIPRRLSLVPPTTTRPCTQVVLSVTLAGRGATSSIVLGCLRDPPPASELPDTFVAFSGTAVWLDVMVAACHSPGKTRIRLGRACEPQDGVVAVGHPHPRREMVA